VVTEKLVEAAGVGEGEGVAGVEVGLCFEAESAADE
jgi:hypothetical protein